MRKAITASAAILLLAGCARGTGGQVDDDAEYSPDADLSGSLTVMGFSGVDEVATTRIDRAKEDLDGVDINIVEGELDIQQFLSAVASGEPPDLIYADRSQVGSLAARGALIPLESCIDGEQIDLDQYVDSAVEQVNINGSVYGIPEFNSVQVTMAHAELLEEAGVIIEDVNGSDWEAMAAASTALLEVMDGDDAIGVDSKLPEFLPLWAKAGGVDLVSEDGRTAQLDAPEVAEALEWAVGLYNDQGGFSAVKSIRDSADFFGAENQFATDSLGAMPMEQWYINVLNDVSPETPMAFDTVRDTSGEPLAYTSGSAWAVAAGAENPEAACRWAKVMTSVDTWKAAAQARLDAREDEGKPFTGVLTGNADADEQIKGMTTPGGDPWDAAVEAMYEANEHGFALPANPADAEFMDATKDAVNKVLDGKAEPKDALAHAQQVAQEALDDAWERLDGDE